MLKQTFIDLLGNYKADKSVIEALWTEIETNYSNRKRYYHTLDHLENLLRQLKGIKSQIADWNTILFSIYYHDIIYNALKNDNEEKSPLLAEKRMKSISVPDEIINRCKQQILATKTHHVSLDKDTNFFTDADLSVLGQDWNTYLNYCAQIRKEYSVSPDLIYKPGRKKMLLHFLQMHRIFKTDYFFEKFEAQARQNLRQELEEL
jgi:predicted metal-dependent HD superfamily phosphohydrolase